uniref:Beta/gamma crystallin 'Greek key' domain-containing protein n=1 Tax=Electrophorus electricus TaxID=8005 RepID=A0A4W4E073_ELEEL
EDRVQQRQHTEEEHPLVSKIIVYEHINFEGLSKEFTSNVSNLVEHFFNDTISSLKVIGNPWVAYTDINFSGSQAVYEEGEYNRVNPNDSISSLEMITDDLTNPQITLYEHSFTSNVSNLVEHFFNDTISSLKVIGNPWVAYTDINFSGSQAVYEEGEYNRVNPNDSISSLEMITDDLTNPQITLYEHSAYRGAFTEHSCFNMSMNDQCCG